MIPARLQCDEHEKRGVHEVSVAARTIFHVMTATKQAKIPDTSHNHANDLEKDEHRGGDQTVGVATTAAIEFVVYLLQRIVIIESRSLMAQSWPTSGRQRRRENFIH